MNHTFTIKSTVSTLFQSLEQISLVVIPVQLVVANHRSPLYNDGVFDRGSVFLNHF